MPWRETLCPRLTPRIAKAVRALSDAEAASLREIRVRLGSPTLLVFSESAREILPVVDQAEMDALLAALSGYALYACERQMAEGYIPLGGGHRAGVCGRLVEEAGKPARMSAVTSVCVRVARHVPGASEGFRAHLLDRQGCARRVLLLGPPGCGKTTALRDAALYLAKEHGLQVCVADERQELFCALGSDAIARQVDVLSGADKAGAVRMLLRSMAPDMLVTDEIGKAQDVDALLDAARCGVGLLASAHAGGMEDMLRRPALRALFDARAFDRYVLLGRRAAVAGIWNDEGRPVSAEKNRDEGENVWQDGTSP